MLRRPAVLLVALAVTLAACDRADEAPFGTDEVTVEPVAQVIATPATVIARTYAATVRTAERADVVAPGAATLAELDVADGDAVTAGQRLGRLTSDVVTTALRQAEAARASAVASLRAAEDAQARLAARTPDDPVTYADRVTEIGALLGVLRDDIAEYRANEDLLRLRPALALEQQLLAELDESDRTRDNVTAARSALSQADQTLRQARRALEDLELVAPLDGVVRLAPDLAAGGGRRIEVGSDLAPVTGELLRIDLAVPEVDLAPVTEGARVAVDLEAYPGVPLQGRIDRIVGAPTTGTDRTSATFVAEVELDDDAGLALRDGLTGTAVLTDLAFAERFEVRLEVDEIDVVLVEVGQPVASSSTRCAAQPLTGTIVAIAATPERGRDRRDVYRARVRLDAPEGDAPPLRGGLTGTGDVEVQRLEAPLTVPSTALRRSGGSEVVYVVRGGVAVEVPVRVLAFGDLRAAIEGDVASRRAGHHHRHRARSRTATDGRSRSR
jgi:multidrug efflux pump subunit AcrA (membrane-fusion protein)